MGRLTNRKGHVAGPPEHRTALDRSAARRPPRQAEWLLSRFSPRGLEDELQGDLQEMYSYWVKTTGVSRARWRYTLAVLRLILPFSRPEAQPSHEYPQPLPVHLTILTNYLKIATRNLSKNAFFTMLNVFGLAVGMSLNLLYVAMVVFVCQFDNFHPNQEHIYRVITHVQDRKENPTFASVPISAAQLLKGHFTGVEKVVRIHQSLPRDVRYANTKCL